MTLENYYYKNLNVGFGALWIMLENIIEECFNGDFDTYGYTKRGRIYNKENNVTVCNIDYFIEYDGSRKIYFLDKIWDY